MNLRSGISIWVGCMLSLSAIAQGYKKPQLKSAVASTKSNPQQKNYIEVWNKEYKGTTRKRAHAITPANDGGFILVGEEFISTPANYAEEQAWVAKIDSAGNMLWSKTYGGVGDERAYAIVAVENGYVIMGNTESADGDIAGHHGKEDGWLFKINESGQLLYSTVYGGSEEDSFDDMVKQGEYIYLVGLTRSNDGDITNAHGEADAWIVKADAKTGAKIWSKNLGGSDYERADDIAVANGKLVIAGNTQSEDGDIAAKHSDKVPWLFIINEAGDIQWQRLYHAPPPYTIKGDVMILSQEDSYQVNNLLATSDGGFLLTGEVRASLENDVWVMRLDKDGSPLWEKSCGGSSSDQAFNAVETASHDLMIIGQSYSRDGVMKNNWPGHNAMLMKLDAKGNLKWVNSPGGAGYNGFDDIIPSATNDIVVIGKRTALDYKYSNVWLLKIREGKSENVNLKSEH